MGFVKKARKDAARRKEIAVISLKSQVLCAVLRYGCGAWGVQG